MCSCLIHADNWRRALANEIQILLIPETWIHLASRYGRVKMVMSSSVGTHFAALHGDMSILRLFNFSISRYSRVMVILVRKLLSGVIVHIHVQD